MEGRLARIGLRIWVGGVLLFLFVPIAIICVYAFNASNVQSWPIQGLERQVVPGGLARPAGPRGASCCRSRRACSPR